MRAPHRKKMPRGGMRSYGGEPTFGVWSKEDARFIIVIKNKSYKISRLVCEAFNGPPPFPRAVAMHLDENPANNRSGNLGWGTQKENLNAQGFLEFCKSRTGESNPFIKGRKKKQRQEAPLSLTPIEQWLANNV